MDILKLRKYNWAVMFRFPGGGHGITASGRKHAVHYLREEIARLSGQGIIPDKIILTAKKLPGGQKLEIAFRHVLKFSEEAREDAEFYRKKREELCQEWRKYGQMEGKLEVLTEWNAKMEAWKNGG